MESVRPDGGRDRSRAVGPLHDPRARDSQNHHRHHPHAQGHHQTEQNLEKAWRTTRAFSSKEGNERGEQDGDGVMWMRMRMRMRGWMGLGLGLEVGVVED